MHTSLRSLASSGVFKEIFLNFRNNGYLTIQAFDLDNIWKN
jgi:hypothetical protein